jgi:hypothetical protein
MQHSQCSLKLCFHDWANLLVGSFGSEWVREESLGRHTLSTNKREVAIARRQCCATSCNVRGTSLEPLSWFLDLSFSTLPPASSRASHSTPYSSDRPCRGVSPKNFNLGELSGKLSSHSSLDQNTFANCFGHLGFYILFFLEILEHLIYSFFGSSLDRQ